MDFLYAETTIAAVITFFLMVVAFKLPHIRKFHISVMVGCMIFDLLMPVYLYLNRDWYGRLIEGGEIFNFLIWMHFGLVITVFIMYYMQISAGRRLLAGDNSIREEHSAIGKGMLLSRGLMILTGALLYEAEKVI